MSKLIGFYVWVFHPEKNTPAADKIAEMADAITAFMTAAGIADFTVEHSFKVSDCKRPFVAFEVKTDLDFADPAHCDMAGAISGRLRLEAARSSRSIFRLIDLDVFWSCYQPTDAFAA